MGILQPHFCHEVVIHQQGSLNMDWSIKFVDCLFTDWRQIHLRCIYVSSFWASRKHLKVGQHVKLLGMEEEFKEKVHESLTGGGLLALFDGTVTIHLDHLGN